MKKEMVDQGDQRGNDGRKSHSLHPVTVSDCRMRLNYFCLQTQLRLRSPEADACNVGIPLAVAFHSVA